MAVVSSDHADARYAIHDAASSLRPVRRFSPEEISRHNAEDPSAFWACVDGFVVDAGDYLRAHPGGKKKVLATNDPETGDDGRPFAFSFSKGRNAHFSGTARIFRDGVRKFLEGGTGEVRFPGKYRDDPEGRIVILGRLEE